MDQRLLPVDFKEFLKLLNSNNVQYLLVGGWAVGFYGYSRFTADMDIFIGISEENISSMKLALHQLCIPIISVHDLIKNKSSTGRAKDKADLEELRKFLG